MRTASFTFSGTGGSYTTAGAATRPEACPPPNEEANKGVAPPPNCACPVGAERENPANGEPVAPVPTEDIEPRGVGAPNKLGDRAGAAPKPPNPPAAGAAPNTPVPNAPDAAGTRPKGGAPNERPPSTPPLLGGAKLTSRSTTELSPAPAIAPVANPPPPPKTLRKPPPPCSTPTFVCTADAERDEPEDAEPANELLNTGGPNAFGGVAAAPPKREGVPNDSPPPPPPPPKVPLLNDGVAAAAVEGRRGRLKGGDGVAAAGV